LALHSNANQQITTPNHLAHSLFFIKFGVTPNFIKNKLY
jgi:hypothetical protein